MEFIYSQCTKGIYVDEHEREDVVAYQKEFLGVMNGHYIFLLIKIN
jgi:hypothetical protein